MAHGRKLVALFALAFMPGRARAQARAIDLTTDTVVTVLSDTAVARIWKAVCGGVAPKDSAIVFGVIRDAKTRALVPNAYVDIVWTQLIVEKNNTVRQRRLRLDTKANADGLFGICGVPAGQFLRIGAGNGGRVSGLIDIPPGPQRIIRRDLMVGAERDTTERGIIVGTLYEISGDTTLANARIIVDDSVEARTGTDGHFIIRNIPTGTRQVEVLSIGMVPVVAAVDVFPGDSTPVTLSIRRVTALDAVRVTASKRARAIIDGLEERKKLGGGYLLEAGEIYGHADLATVFQEFPSTQVDRRGGDITVWTPARNGTLCQPEIWVDGARSAQYILPQLRMSEVVAVEMYPRPGAVPLQFKNSSMRNECGVILLWTTWVFSR
jgi:hypothetical protein